ncbi:MAG: HypC/HybG/HupF family hydrogenase formation chaperone [Candidatus Krumholzibacteria bacterium]|nr:HypC/HybG/HupF family hydrogenase formation chaperone [Candidatus Krumholzibacteria bacterium]
MCLGIPMKVIEKKDNEAVAEAGGIRKNVRLDLLEETQVGDYVLIHTGYAIEKLDPEEARETLELIRQVYRAGLTNKADGT